LDNFNKKTVRFNTFLDVQTIKTGGDTALIGCDRGDYPANEEERRIRGQLAIFAE
jgi:hypothetical protein